MERLNSAQPVISTLICNCLSRNLQKQRFVAVI